MIKRFAPFRPVAVFIACVSLLIPASAQIVVTSAADSGAGTLR
jgi:hypothetical protein